MKILTLTCNLFYSTGGCLMGKKKYFEFIVNEKTIYLTKYILLYIFQVLRTAASMSLLSQLFILWPSSVLSVLLVWLVDRQLGPKVGVQVVQTLTCSQWSTQSNHRLFKEGEVVIGGLFNVRHQTPAIDHDFTQLPHYKPCAG